MKITNEHECMEAMDRFYAITREVTGITPALSELFQAIMAYVWHTENKEQLLKLFDDVTALEAVFNLRRWSETRLVW